MLEITVSRFGGVGNTARTFQFENDELQAFLTEGAQVAGGAAGPVFNIGGLRALGGVPAYAHGYGSDERMPADRATRPQPDPRDARQTSTDRDTLGIRTPIQETARAAEAERMNAARAPAVAAADKAKSEKTAGVSFGSDAKSEKK